MSIASTGLSHDEKPITATRGAAGDEDIGGFTTREMCGRFRFSLSTLYAEARAGRLRLSKVRNKTIVTRGDARAYQALLEQEAEAKWQAAELE
jgi:hypothetical protein